MLLFMAGSGTSIMTAGENSSERHGYGEGYGTLTRSPVLLRAEGSEIEALVESGGGQMLLVVSGDQTTFLTGKSLYIDATEYAASGAASGPTYDAGDDDTRVEWAGAGDVFADGGTYVIRIE